MPAKKILIVDYDIQSLAALARLFEPYGFEIIEATDGLTAFEKFKSDHPDLVLLEAILPKFHGFDLTRRIHQESKGTVPVVMRNGSKNRAAPQETRPRIDIIADKLIDFLNGHERKPLDALQ